jgi:hypothetical protein
MRRREFLHSARALRHIAFAKPLIWANQLSAASPGTIKIAAVMLSRPPALLGQEDE